VYEVLPPFASIGGVGELIPAAPAIING
jgi:hypothetical protein